MSEKTQDVVYGAALLIIPVALAICSLILDFHFIDLFYLISVIILGIEYIVIYRRCHR